MSPRLIAIMSLLAVIATLSVGTASPLAEVTARAVVAAEDPASSATNVTAQLAVGQVLETSVPVLISFKHSDEVGKVTVLFGPTHGATETAKGFITNLGGFHVDRGFAYMKYSKPAAAQSSQTSAAAGVPTTQPANSRPYIRTKRVNAVGEGTAWAVEVGAAHDRIYFVEGTKVECTSRIVSRFNKTLNHGSLKSFTTLAEHNATTSLDPFSSEEQYAFHTDASEFAAYVDGFKSWSTMPPMQ